MIGNIKRVTGEGVLLDARVRTWMWTVMKTWLERWCFIRIKKNFSKSFQKSSKHWVSDLYVFLKFTGHCYTYNPPSNGVPDYEGGIGLFLGNLHLHSCINTIWTQYYVKIGHHDGYNIGLKQHDIFIHEKGQFWLNDNIPKMGRWKQKLNRITRIYFQTVQYNKVSFKM